MVFQFKKRNITFIFLFLGYVGNGNAIVLQENLNEIKMF